MKRSLSFVITMFSIASALGQNASVTAPAQLTTYVRPVYPNGEKEGTFHSVTLAATLGTDGQLHNLAPLGTSDAFVQAAEDAASHWVYTPYTLNGQPIEMKTVVSVIFGAQEHRVTFDKPLRVSETVMARLIDKKIQPSHTKTTGTVVLSVVIGRDGSVGNIQVVSGPRSLQDASLEAARQWTYKPYLVDGVPVEIATTLMFNF